VSLLLLVVGEVYLVGGVVTDWGVELVLLIMIIVVRFRVCFPVPADIRVPGGQPDGVEGGAGHTNTQAHIQRDESWVPLQTGESQSLHHLEIFRIIEIKVKCFS